VGVESKHVCRERDQAESEQSKPRFGMRTRLSIPVRFQTANLKRRTLEHVSHSVPAYRILDAVALIRKRRCPACSSTVGTCYWRDENMNLKNGLIVWRLADVAHNAVAAAVYTDTCEQMQQRQVFFAFRQDHLPQLLPYATVGSERPA
jgi:hypothetical protein